MDFRSHVDSEKGGTGWGEQGLERGAMVDCDRCGHTSQIVAIETVTIMKLLPIK